MNSTTTVFNNPISNSSLHNKHHSQRPSNPAPKTRDESCTSLSNLKNLANYTWCCHSSMLRLSSQIRGPASDMSLEGSIPQEPPYRPLQAPRNRPRARLLKLCPVETPYVKGCWVVHLRSLRRVPRSNPPSWVPSIPPPAGFPLISRN